MKVGLINKRRCVFMEAIHLANQGIEEDEEKNYSKALDFYEKAEGYFIFAIKNEAPTDRAAEAIRENLKIFQDRAKILRSYLEKRKVPYGRRAI